MANFIEERVEVCPPESSEQVCHSSKPTHNSYNIPLSLTTKGPC